VIKGLVTRGVTRWFEQDQAILSAILSSLSPEVLNQCLFPKTSKGVWDKLDRPYAAQSWASAMHIHIQLATLKKHDLSGTDYYNHIKSFTDTLAAARAPLRDDEIVAYLLTGLPEEFDSLVTSVTTRAKPMSLSEVYTNMISFENRLISRQGVPGAASGSAMNFTSCGGRGGCHLGGQTGGRSGGCGSGRNGGRVGDSGSGHRPRC
jgi:hypothetical protein